MGSRKWLFFTAAALVLAGCGGGQKDGQLRVALSADYPPFEYVERGEIVGFDVDLSRAVGAELDLAVVFQDMAFAAILPAISSGRADMAASTIAVTDERKENYSFTRTYFNEELQVLFPADRRPDVAGKFSGQRVACQIGTTMEMWLRRNAPACKIQTFDSNVQAVEALRAGHADAVVVDSFQAKSFCSRDGQLGREFLARSDSGYAIAFEKNSPLLGSVDGVLEKLQRDGTLDKLKRKWGLL